MKRALISLPAGGAPLVTEPTATNQGYIGMEEIKNRASGATFSEITKTSFRPIPAVCPGEYLMRVFHKNVATLYERMLLASREATVLKTLRDILLPNLVSGKIQIPDAEEFAKEAGVCLG